MELETVATVVLSDPERCGAARRAVIDIGTNSVKLLVADVQGDVLAPVFEASEQTRLGWALYGNRGKREMSDDAVRHTASAVVEFVGAARSRGACAVRVIATSALRDAANRDALRAAIRESAGPEVEVIPAAIEADWVFRGVTSDPDLGRSALLVLDVGGGSTEFIVGRDGMKTFGASYPLGAVRSLATLRPSDKPTAEEMGACLASIRGFLEREVGPELRPALAGCGRRPVGLVGAGGTAAILGLMELGANRVARDRLDGFCLTRVQVRHHLEFLWSLSLAERRQVSGLPPERADVILTGAAIFASVMAFFEFAALRISLRGLRYAALLDEGYAGWRCGSRPTGTVAEGGDARAEARRFLAERDPAPAHSEKVAALALALFDGLSALHGFGARERLWLEVAALLHDIGWAVVRDGKGHHKKTAELILSRSWTSLDARARDIVALVARYHRKSVPVMRHAAFAALSVPDRRRVLQLAGILRLADGLDRPHRQRVRTVAVEIEAGALRIVVAGEKPLRRELAAAERKSDLARLAFRRRVVVRTVHEEVAAR